MRPLRRNLVRAIALGCAFGIGAAAAQSGGGPAGAAPPAAPTGDYPNRPVRIIVAYPAGQGTDVATRHIAEQLSKALGQPFVVENRPGAGGNIGTQQAARAPADGYTLVMGTVATHTMNQHMYPNVGYDPDADFEPIGLTGMLPMVLSASPGFAAGSVADVIAAAKAKPDAINVAIPSTTARIVFELFKQQTGAPLYGVPYRGSAQAMTDVMAGQVNLTIDTVTATRTQAASGKIKPIAITSARSSELLPGVPSVAEQGVRDFEITAWNALFAPKGTPPEIVERLSGELRKIMALPDTRAKLMQMGFEPRSGSARELGDYVRSERARWGQLIKSANIRAE